MAKLEGKKVLACCANGAGSSLMTEKAIQKVLAKHGITLSELRHCPISEGTSAAKSYDVVFCSKIFFKNFEHVGGNTVVIPLKNVMSDKEIEEGLQAAGLLD